MDEGSEKNVIIKRKDSNIIRDSKQIRVAIPAEFDSLFAIDESNDSVVWLVKSNDKNELSLEARLIKGGKNNA